MDNGDIAALLAGVEENSPLTQQPPNSAQECKDTAPKQLVESVEAFNEHRAILDDVRQYKTIDKATVGRLVQTFPALLTPRVSLESFTQDPSKTNLRETQLCVENAVNAEGAGIVSRYKCYVEGPFARINANIQELHNEVIPTLLAMAQSTRSEIEAYRNRARVDNKPYLMSINNEPSELLSVNVATFENHSISNTVQDRDLLCLCMDTITESLKSASINKFINSAGADYSQSSELRVVLDSLATAAPMTNRQTLLSFESLVSVFTRESYAKNVNDLNSAVYGIYTDLWVEASDLGSADTHPELIYRFLLKNGQRLITLHNSVYGLQLLFYRLMLLNTAVKEMLRIALTA